MSGPLESSRPEQGYSWADGPLDTGPKTLDFWAGDPSGEAPGDPSGEELDAVGRHGDPHLMTPEEAGRLEPERYRVAVDRLHPDRLHPPEPAALDRLAGTNPQRSNISEWAPRVNPGYLQDAVLGRSGRTQNCADCARAVQDTLDGQPRVASSIDRHGLPLEGERPSGGEDVAYTEQWAGRRFEDTDYDAIGRRVEQERGSAIIAAYRRTGGHAFNAVWDGNSVRLVDGQTGHTYPWESAPYRQRFSTFRAIHFPGGTQA